MLLQNGDVLSLCLASLAVLANIVADLLSIGQRAAEAYGRDMNEDVWAAVIRSNEAEALILCEKFNCTGCHVVLVFRLEVIAISSVRPNCNFFSGAIVPTKCSSIEIRVVFLLAARHVMRVCVVGFGNSP